jgi:hypothetical protein
MKTTLIAIAMVVAMPLTAMAAQCTSMQMQVDKEFGKRFDRTASTVRQAAKKAQGLCKSGKDAESVKVYQDAMKAAHAGHQMKK